MNPDAIGEGRRWLRQAEQDLDDARYNLEGNRIIWFVFFHSNQQRRL